MGDTRDGNQVVRADVLAASCFAAIVLAVFLPHGLSQLPTAEAWSLVDLASRDASIPFQTQPRIAQTLFWRVATAMNPDSFVHVNAIQGALYFLRSWLLFVVVRRLWPGQSAVAFAAAALFMFHPADTGYFWLSTVFIMLCLVAILGCVALLILYGQGGSKWVLAPMMALQALVLWGYEGYTPALLLAPLLWFLLPPRSDRKLVPAAALFGLLPTLWVLSMVLIPTMGRAHTLWEPEPWRALRSIGFGFSWVFLGGWVESLATMEPSAWDVVLAAGAGIAAGAVVTRLAGAEERVARRKPWLVLVLVSSVLLLSSRIPYAVTFLAQRTERTMFLASASGALVTAGLCALLADAFGRHRRRAFSSMVAILVSLTVLHGLAVRSRYVELGLRRGVLIARILEAAPRVTPDTVILVLPGPKVRAPLFARYPGLLNAALKVLGGATVWCAVSPGIDGGEPRFDLDSETVEIPVPEGRRDFSLQNLVVISVPDEGPSALLDEIPGRWIAGQPSPASYRPRARLADAPYLPRACTMLRGAALPSFCPR